MCVNVGRGAFITSSWFQASHCVNSPTCYTPGESLWRAEKGECGLKNHTVRQDWGEKMKSHETAPPQNQISPMLNSLRLFKEIRMTGRAVGLLTWSQTGFPNGFRRDNQCVYKSPLSTAPGPSSQAFVNCPASAAPSLHLWARNTLKSHYPNMDWPIHSPCVECSQRVREDVTHALVHHLSKLWVDSFKHLPYMDLCITICSL